MLRKVFFILILSAPLLSQARRADPDPYNQPISTEQIKNAKIRRELSELGVGSALKMNETAGHIDDESATYRLPALYWEHTLKVKKGDKEEEKLTEIEENLTTPIPQSLNNIAVKVAEQDWKNRVTVNEAETQEWKRNNPTPLMKYVSTNDSGAKTLKSLDEQDFYTAFKIYKKAQEDRESIQKHFRSVADSNPDPEKTYQEKNDKLAITLDDYFKSQANLLFYRGMQDLVLKRQAPNRAPASTGEHNNSAL